MTPNDQAVSIVNAYEVRFKANYQTYAEGRESAAQGAAVFDQLWSAMSSQLQPLGSAGQKALSDRGPGGKFPWFTWYRPPAPATTSSGAAGSSLVTAGVSGVGTASAASSSGIWLLLIGVAAFLLLKRKGGL